MTRHLFLPVDNSILLKFRAKRGDVPPIPPCIFWPDGKNSHQKNNPPPIPTETRHLYLPRTTSTRHLFLPIRTGLWVTLLALAAFLRVRFRACVRSFHLLDER
jgi:hypothetical protein